MHLAFRASTITGNHPISIEPIGLQAILSICPSCPAGGEMAGWVVAVCCDSASAGPRWPSLALPWPNLASWLLLLRVSRTSEEEEAMSGWLGRRSGEQGCC